MTEIEHHDQGRRIGDEELPQESLLAACVSMCVCWRRQLLRRQLDTLRAIDESRSRACEEVDRSAHELEKANAKLQRERQTDVETIRR